LAVSFVSDMGFTIFTLPATFSNGPRQFTINNEGVETYTYAAVPPGSTVVGVTGAGGTTGAGGVTGAAGTGAQAGVASGCDRPTGDRLLTMGIADVQQKIHGTWVLCSALGLFGQPQSGVLIGDDDSLVLLDVVDGKLVPKTGLENKAHLEYIDTSSDNGPNSTQVDFDSDVWGIALTNPIFSDDPRQLIIDNESGDIYTYGRVP
jgi:hypothetical protein